MSKTQRHEATEPAEMTDGGNITPPSLESWDDGDYGWLLYLASLPPEDWSAEALRILGRWANVGPWRHHRQGEGLADWGAVPGTVEGCHRYYFAAVRGRDPLRGTIVANGARAVERWLRDSERAQGYASRDPRAIREE